MNFKTVYLQEFLNNKDYYYEQIPKVQNFPDGQYESVFEYFKKYLAGNEKSFFTTCEINGELIGINLITYFPEEDKFYLMNVNTRKDYQHTDMKIGTKTTQFSLDNFFKTSEYDRIYLWVRPDNAYAKKLYENLGFEPTDYFPTKLDFLENIKNDEIYELTKERYFENSNNLCSTNRLTR